MSSIPPLGDGALNIPYEERKEALTVELEGYTATGLVVAGATVDLEAGKYPAVVFRFGKPDGSFFHPMTLIASPAELKALTGLVEKAVNSAIKAARA